jgi:hypothetical protein
LVVLLVDVSDFVDEGDAVVLFKVLVEEALFVMIVVFVVSESAIIVVSVVDELGRNLAI